MKQLLFYRTSAEIAQFCSGLNDVFGFWDIVKQNPKTWKGKFSAMPQNMNKRMFQSLYDIKWSVIGSNRRAEKEDSIYCWEIFLQDIDEKEVDVSFEELLFFVTGADEIPPAGFSNNI
ncbi:G2/M phase-specific E3 ubiquitin-protein ligase-like [Mytilus galloprovincialis]|uniref:G2/M phase-specific E3 ubiquitin-protein ligase-like n=1 Tax=Mytilus galloprovincialis TaxID=29158 RepID=UPI003F7B62E3